VAPRASVTAADEWHFGVDLVSLPKPGLHQVCMLKAFTLWVTWQAFIQRWLTGTVKMHAIKTVA